MAPARLALLVLSLACVGWPAAAAWQASLRGAIEIDVSAVTDAQELSGLAYVGQGTGGVHRFQAVQDSGGRVVELELGIASDASITTATAISATPLATTLDMEGIAPSPTDAQHFYIAEEGGPSVREFDLATGQQTGSVTIPAVFAERRGNRGFESLTRSYHGDEYWTGNEEALTVDGPASTTTASTIVRLLRLDAADGAPIADQQFAYAVEPIHNSLLADRSGLVDLVGLPDGELLAMERSFGGLQFLNRVYQVDFTGATDLSAPAFDSGLIGKSYTQVGKNQLYSGVIGGGLAGNFEGLALGPQLPSGAWSLIAVADNASGSSQLVASFELTPPLPASPGDYNGDGSVDADDYRTWRHSYGLTLPAGRGADGDGDGQVTAADYAVWRNHLGSAAPAANGAPEPAGWVLCSMLLLNASAWGIARKRTAGTM